MKILYLLALFQLVAGPLVIFQVSLLCRMTLREAPALGLGPAFTQALDAPEIRLAAVDRAAPAKAVPSGKKSPAPEPKGKAMDGKIAALPWHCVSVLSAPQPQLAAIAGHIRLRLPVWPQAPPAPPPRVG